MDSELIEACALGNIDEAKVLLESGADVHTTNDASLRYASRNGDIKLVEMLVKYGANINAECKITSYTASYNASFNGNIKVVDFLLNSKADISKLADNFVHKYMQINEENISYLFALDRIANLSKVKYFSYEQFKQVKIRIQSIINELLGKNIGNIAFEYI